MKNKVFVLVIILIGLSNIFPQNLFRSGHFLHHSSGDIIWGSSSPNIPQLINMYNIERNYTGDNAVTMTRAETFFPSLNNGGNFYDAWHAVFVGQSAYPEEDSALQQYIQNNKIVVIKACWGASGIAPMGDPADTLIIDDELSATGRTYYRTQWHWRNMIRVMQNHPDRFFVIWTGLPLNPGPSYNGTLAHNFFIWAKDTLAAGNDPVLGAFPKNVYVFDVFHLLAVPTQNLPWGTAYWGMNPLYHDEGDNHPNQTGADVVAHAFIWETFDAAIAYEAIVNGTGFQFTVPIQDGWNMVSVPGLHPTNQNVSTWWSGKDPSADVFRFSAGYVQVTTTRPGQGYWMKHLGANIYNTSGVIPVANDPIAGAAGWNLIGGYELNILTANITTTPGGLQSGQVFGYSGGYMPATNLVPGNAYWINLTGAGSINIPNALAKGVPKTTEVNKSDWGKIIITDNSGNSYTLYIVKGEVNLDDYELPPAPPEGMFDVRYESGRYAEELSLVNQSIELNSLEYPVKVRIENADIRLQDETGNGLNERLKSGEELTISSSSINKLMVSGDIVPDKYALEQNYPNPFNPSTKIEFSLPEDVNNVTLTIFNVLGQRVAELVNSKQVAGKYSYIWNGSDVSSGLYIYELRTNKFVSSKKMMLLK